MLFDIFAVILLVLQLILPARWAFAPLIVATLHLGNTELIPQLTIVRMVVIAGIARAFFTGKFSFSLKNRLDVLMLFFSVAALISSVGHTPSIFVPSPFAERCGLVLNVTGTYLYSRAFLRGANSILRVALVAAWTVLPLAGGMVFEQITGLNAYTAFGSKSDVALVRDNRFRATGPFGHAILAGTAGAATLPLIAAIRRRRPTTAMMGYVCCVLITIASASSGPLLTLLVSCMVLYLWRLREKVPLFLKVTAGSLVVLHLIMKQPVWFLIAKIDIVGGSTGWHRAKIIDTAIEHLDEWWLFGTDYTRHWMPTGLRLRPEHTDLTNYYVHLGVLGGVVLPILLIWLLAVSLRVVVRNFRTYGGSVPDNFTLWCVAGALVAHAVTFLSVSYFGQMYSMVFMLLGFAGSLLNDRLQAKNTADLENSPQ